MLCNRRARSVIVCAASAPRLAVPFSNARMQYLGAVVLALQAAQSIAPAALVCTVGFASDVQLTVFDSIW